MRTKSFATAVLLFDEVEVLDVAAPVQVLSAAGRAWNFRPFKIELVGETRRAFATRNQLELQASARFKGAAAPEVLIIPGGYGARRAAEHAATVDWVREASARAELVGSIGNGALLLAKAGLLSGAEVAAPLEIAPALSALDPTLSVDTHARLRSSGRVVTARASAHGLELGLFIVEHLFGQKFARAVALSLGLDGPEPAERIEIVAGESAPRSRPH